MFVYNSKQISPVQATERIPWCLPTRSLLVDIHVGSYRETVLPKTSVHRMVRVWEEELFQEEPKTQAVSKRFPLLFHAGLKFMPQTCKDDSAIKSSLFRPGEMTQQLKAGSALPEDLGSIPTTYLVAINRLFLRDLIPSCSFRGHHVCTWYKHTHRQNTQTCKNNAKVHFPSSGLEQCTHLQPFLLLYSCRFWVTQRKMNFIVFTSIKVRFPRPLVNLQLSPHHPYIYLLFAATPWTCYWAGQISPLLFL